MEFKYTFHICTFTPWSLRLWWNDGYLPNLALYQRQDNKIEGKGLQPEPVLKNPTPAWAPAIIAKLRLHHSSSSSATLLTNEQTQSWLRDPLETRSYHRAYRFGISPTTTYEKHQSFYNGYINLLYNKLSLAKIGSEKLSSKIWLRFVLLRKYYQLGLAQRSSAFKINHCTDLFYSERLYPTFGSLSWFWRCREHPHPLSPHLGLWRMLEVPDWGLASLLSFGYGQWSLIKWSEFWLSILV